MRMKSNNHFADDREAATTVARSGNQTGHLRLASLWLLWFVAGLFAVLFGWAAIAEIDTSPGQMAG